MGICTTEYDRGCYLKKVTLQKIKMGSPDRLPYIKMQELLHLHSFLQ